MVGSYADMAKLADALDLGSSGATRAGSSPVIRILRREIEIFRFRAVFAEEKPLSWGLF